jgi:TRAP-type mannitol/chloroaromatic compound transport system permease small subunit
VSARLFGHLTEVLNTLGTLWILALMLLINADVVGRSVFSRPIAGVPEIVSLSIIGIVFLQLASTLRAGRMTRSDMLLNALERRAPRVMRGIDFLFNLAGVYIVSVIFFASYPRFTTAVARNEFVGAIGHFTAPTWPIKLVLLIGAAALALQFLIQALYSLIAALGPRPKEARQGADLDGP